MIRLPCPRTNDEIAQYPGRRQARCVLRSDRRSRTSKTDRVRRGTVRAAIVRPGSCDFSQAALPSRTGFAQRAIIRRLQASTVDDR
ncbi:unnamed protein product [Didymodactylos carnosus]|uniref:Uncharacterized protein n=1 Tax=Didymodactylos carnosus TaxID=1234261 RepID=A0A816HLE7_9BILA|nr:unnamed protein product [Didymodactylos carnosus]CAF4040777.1 unnamed protein product [Didymodactylos carnosus]